MPAPPPSHLPFILSILLLLLHLTPINATNHPDLAPLLSFKSTSDLSNKLSTWTNSSSSDPCHTTPAFLGVSCLHNRVTKLVLENLTLHGRFDSLTSLVKLRVLSLKHNNLTGPIPNLSNLTSLKLLFLSHNQLTGNFPPFLPSLFRLDLSHNKLSGTIPLSLNRLTFLLTLYLQENQLSGSIHFLNLSNLQHFNISTNNISGEIPPTLVSFSDSVFSNNPILCGFPLPQCKLPSPDVTSSPSSLPWTAAVPNDHNRSGHHNNKISTLAIVAIIIGDVLVLILVSLLLYCYFCKNSGEEEFLKETKTVTPVANSFEKGRMVFFDEGVRRFELEDLLRASAEMLGKGGLGTAYKAVLDDGYVVAVKRLKEVVVTGGKREFEQQMEVLGSLRHVNVVSLKAFYFAKDEKLVVYDYMSNGNLFWLLHGTLSLPLIFCFVFILIVISLYGIT